VLISVPEASELEVDILRSLRYVVGWLITKLRKVYCESVSEKKFNR